MDEKSPLVTPRLMSDPNSFHLNAACVSSSNHSAEKNSVNGESWACVVCGVVPRWRSLKFEVTVTNVFLFHLL